MYAKIESGFVYITKFESGCITMMKETKIIVAGNFCSIIFIESAWNLKSIGCTINNLVVESRSVTGIKWLAVHFCKIPYVITQAGRIVK